MFSMDRRVCGGRVFDDGGLLASFAYECVWFFNFIGCLLLYCLCYHRIHYTFAMYRIEVIDSAVSAPKLKSSTALFYFRVCSFICLGMA